MGASAGAEAAPTPTDGLALDLQTSMVEGAVDPVTWVERWTLSFRQLSGQIKVKSGVIGQAASGCDGAG